MTQDNNSQPVKRKPGGQPGNHNARKHGLRSRKLTPVEREQLNTRIMLDCVEKADGALNRRMAFLTSLRDGKAAFVGKTSNTLVRAMADAVMDAKTAVLIEPSRLKGYLNLKVNITLPVPEILASEAKMQDLIHQIIFFPHSTNDSPTKS
jgi:hypothetical protein